MDDEDEEYFMFLSRKKRRNIGKVRGKTRRGWNLRGKALSKGEEAR